MDTSKFIKEVRKRPPLWDQKDINYHSRVVASRLWAELGRMFGLQVNRAKIKWKSLRDMYRVELKKSLKYNPAGVRSNWAHFESMHFIKEQLHPRNRTDTDNYSSPMASLVLTDRSQPTALKSYQSKLHIPTPNQMICKNMCLAAVRTCTLYPVPTLLKFSPLYVPVYDRTCLIPGEVEVWYADSCDVPPQFDAASTPEEEEDLKNPAELLAMGYPQHGGNFTHLQYAEEEGEDHFPGQREVKRDLDETLVSIEREKLELMRQERKERQDDDFLFLMSLLPTIRGLPLDKRMRLRGRIQDLVSSEVQQATSKKEYS
uniref:MADF domain-containing protein n=1 Tax=Timema douglasi TaxID=61478 RepID=A0A7R8ZC99_TIMDO|nr:unnamed protein product [Timema douglasi]